MQAIQSHIDSLRFNEFELGSVDGGMSLVLDGSTEPTCFLYFYQSKMINEHLEHDLKIRGLELI